MMNNHIYRYVKIFNPIIWIFLCLSNFTFAQNINTSENFPDPFFRNVVETALGASHGESFTEEQALQITRLDASNQNISELTGISFFKNLLTLRCGNNRLQYLDLTQNTSLVTLECNHNLLTYINLSNNLFLENIICNNNQFSQLDLSENKLLTNLNCDKNIIQNLDLSNNPNLAFLSCSFNSITEIDISKNTNLNEIYCSNNQIAELRIDHNNDLEKLSCRYNDLTELDCSDNPSLINLDCDYNQITRLDLSVNHDLKTLFCSHNQLTVLDASNCEKLESLACSHNHLTQLNPSQNLQLRRLICRFNRIFELADILAKTQIAPFDALDIRYNNLDCDDWPDVEALRRLVGEGQLASSSLELNAGLAYSPQNDMDPYDCSGQPIHPTPIITYTPIQKPAPLPDQDVVSNIRIQAQYDEPTHLEIQYDLAHETQPYFFIAIQLLDHAGNEVDVPSQNISGDLGFVSPGSNKTILLTYDENGPLILGETYRISVSAQANDAQYGLIGPSGERIITLGTLESVVISPNGRTFLSLGAIGAFLWDISTRSLLQVIWGEKMLCAAFSPDGNRIIFGDENGKVSIWDVMSRTEIRRINAHSQAIDTIDISPDGDLIITGSRDDSAKLWNASNGRLLETFDDLGGDVASAAFSPSGDQILTACPDAAQLWETSSGQLTRTWDADWDDATSAVFSPDSRYILSSDSITAKLWETSSGQLLRAFYGHSDTINSLEFSQDGAYILTGGQDETFRIWETESGRLIQTYTDASSPIHTTLISPEGSFILMGQENGSIRLIEPFTENLLWELAEHSSPTYSAEFSYDGSKFIAVNGNQAKLWNTADGILKNVFTKDLNKIRSAEFSIDGLQILTVSWWDGKATLWDVLSALHIREFSDYGNWVRTAAFSPDGKNILTGHDDGAVQLWEASTGRWLQRYYGHVDEVWSTAFSPDGALILTGGMDKTVNLWDRASGELLRTFSGYSDGIISAAFSPDGTRILTGGENGTVQIYDSSSGLLQRIFSGHSIERFESWTSFSPNSQQLLIASGEAAKLYDVSTGALLRDFSGHTDWIRSVTFHPGGNQILTGSRDGSVRIWLIDGVFSEKDIWDIAYSEEFNLLQEPTMTPTLSPTSTPTPSSTFAPSPTDTQTPAFSPTPTMTTAPMPTFTPTPTQTPIPTFTNTPTATATFSPTSTHTFTPTYTPTPSATLTSTPTPTMTWTPVFTSTMTPTFTWTPTFTATATPIIEYVCTNNFSLNLAYAHTFESQPDGLLVEDFNQDEILDILTFTSQQNEMLILSHDRPSDAFDEQRIPIDFIPEFIASGDLNGDGLEDVISISYLDFRLDVLFNDPKLDFHVQKDFEIEFFDIQSLAKTSCIQPLVCADLDHDSKDELYFLELNSDINFSAIHKYQFNEMDELVEQTELNIENLGNEDLCAFEFCNLDADEDYELVVITDQNPKIILLDRDHNNQYAAWMTFSLEDTMFGNHVMAFSIHDVNEDGLYEIIVATFDGRIRLFQNNNGLISQSIIGNIGTTSIHDDLLITDLDLDGREDLLIVSRQIGSGDSFEEIRVVCGDEVGEYESVVTFTTDRRSGLGSLVLSTMDYDVDGLEDVVLMDNANNQLLLFRNTSENTNATPTPDPVYIDNWSFY